MFGDVIWNPSKKIVENSNVFAFMQKHGIKKVDELQRKAVKDQEWFWSNTLKDTGIEFFTLYSKVVDLSDGIEWHKWFTGGKMNIAHNCVDKHSKKTPNKIALQWIGENEDKRTL